MNPNEYSGSVQEAGKPSVVAFFDFQDTAFTSTFLIVDKETKKCAVVDPAYNFTLFNGTIETKSIDKVIAFIKEHDLQNEYILDTHAHADHITAAQYLKKKVGGKYCIGANITQVQKAFIDIFNITDLTPDGSQFDQLFSEGDTFQIGKLSCSVLSTPGHTPACISYHVGNSLFCGDTLFCPDMGTARCDFPGGSAQALWNSIQKLLALPPTTRVFVGHDYAPGGRPYKWETTIAEQRENNKHVKSGTSEGEFLEMRTKRDKELAIPNLLYPSIQVNIRAGHLPPPEQNGKVFFKIPFTISE